MSFGDALFDKIGRALRNASVQWRHRHQLGVSAIHPDVVATGRLHSPQYLRKGCLVVISYRRKQIVKRLLWLILQDKGCCPDLFLSVRLLLPLCFFFLPLCFFFLFNLNDNNRAKHVSQTAPSAT